VTEREARCDACLHRVWCKGDVAAKMGFAVRYCGYYTTLAVPPHVIGLREARG
jgi:hypothetical protein